MLDDLQAVIEQLQNMIKTHDDYLSGKETRTRQALIDPLLQQLGWAVSNPDAVQLEYGIENKRADYALMSMSNARPVAVIEAKPLGNSLERGVITQVITYAVEDTIPYIIVTNGNRWEMYEVFKEVDLADKKLMEFELSQQPAHEIVLEALRIWKPNLASGEPKKAKKPVLDAATDNDDNDGIDKKNPTFDDGKTFKEIDGDWTSKTISGFTFDGKTYEVKHWNKFLVKFCEILSKNYPNQFEYVVELKPIVFNKSGVFSAKDADIHEIGKTGVYINAHIPNDRKKKLLEDLVKHFECDMPVPLEEAG